MPSMLLLCLVLLLFALMFGRWWHLLSEWVPPRLRTAAGLCFALLPLAMLGNFLLPQDQVVLRTVLAAVAALWMFGCSLFLPVWILWELSRIVKRVAAWRERRKGRLPVNVWRNPDLRYGRAALALLVFAGLAAFAYVECDWSHEVREYEFHTGKNPERPLRIAFFSDLHFDALYHPGRTERLVEEIEAFGPDVVLFGGDLADVDSALVSARGLGDAFARLRPPLGIWATTGNHEAYLPRRELMPAWAEKRGWTWLRDSTACLEGKLCVTGRLDPNVAAVEGLARAGIEGLRPAGADTLLPWIVLDHQPQLGQREAVEAGADLVLSGHTHDGQTFPWNLVVRLIYENPHGALVHGDGKHRGMAVTSSGFGRWGFPFRLGTSPEIVFVTLR
ncbi:MAG: metallophosphoesterase [Fibrobacterales bacterium]|nr:metallophosphoesterase [Fibrobacterales bacterium]